jgi:hypothetical protein
VAFNPRLIPLYSLGFVAFLLRSLGWAPIVTSAILTCFNRIYERHRQKKNDEKH